MIIYLKREKVYAYKQIKESDKSIILSTDPDCFLNWDPVPGDKFRCDPESQENGYIEYNPFMEEKMKMLTYPE